MNRSKRPSIIEFEEEWLNNFIESNTHRLHND